MAKKTNVKAGEEQLSKVVERLHDLDDLLELAIDPIVEATGPALEPLKPAITGLALVQTMLGEIVDEAHEAADAIYQSTPEGAWVAKAALTANGRRARR